jgi:signal transduction histidine kinase
VRDAGLPVEVRIEGEPRPLPIGVDLSAYRVVQEALTNALKHAGRASATVTVRYGERDVAIEVADDGRGGQPNGTGHGLIGMRERIGVFGGTFDAGPRAGGGFAVRALLPLEGAS